MSADTNTLTIVSSSRAQPPLPVGRFILAGTKFTMSDAIGSPSINSNLVVPPTFQQDVLQKLECQICYQIAVPPINNCVQGHIVCGLCRKTIERCMVCYEELTAERAYALEAIIALLLVKCRNIACPKVVKIHELEEHLQICEFKPIPCWSYVQSVCKGKLIPFHDYFAHFREKHPALYYTNSRSSSSSRRNPIRICIQELLNEARCMRWQPYFISQDGKEFQFLREYQNKTQYFWVTGMMSQAEASQYRATLRISSGTANEKEAGQYSSVEWNLLVQPVHVNWKELIKTANCVQTSVRALAPFGFEIGDRIYLDITCIISKK